MNKIGRNDPCPCGSGKKFKNCCLPIIHKEKFSEHSKRMSNLSSIAPPPPWTKQFEEFHQFYKKEYESKVNIKEVAKRFKIATTKVTNNLLNGADLLCDQNLRYFYQEYNDRLFNYGLWSFPTSFNVGEAFMNYIHSLNCFELKEEKDYLFSFEEYMEFVTSESCNDKYKDAINDFEEGIVYNFNNSDDLEKFTLKTRDNVEYVFGGISLIRYHDELNLIMTIGEITDTKSKDEEIKKVKWQKSTNPAKKNLKPDEKLKQEVIRLNGIENLWHQIVMSRFDFSDLTQNVRCILKDQGNSFFVSTDDASCFIHEYDNSNDDEINTILKNMSKELDLKSTLFELCKFMIFLPKYFNQNEDRIEIERHPTKLIEYLNKDISKEFNKIIEKKKQIHYRNVSILTKTNKMSPDIITTKAPGLKIEMTGYWKKLKPNQMGVNKKGDPIHGKTWVEQKLSWLESDDEEVVKLYRQHNSNAISGENEGIIYVMRSAAHSKDIFKIGLTTRSSEIRSSELERTTGSPDKFLVVEEWYVIDCYRAEKEIHEKLDRFRINPSREFFKGSYDSLRKEFIEIIEKYKKIEVRNDSSIN